jgi:LmbE family N-acetylglucosaminyl deacetylase
MASFPTGRVVVLSPHLDDAVLGLGAAINRAVAEGGHVRVVTAFAGDVESELPASRWDALAGYVTEGEAARARRAEDAEACAVVGAEPHPLAFSDYPYVRGREPDAVVAALSAAVDAADAVFAPGFPLIHADHRFLAECVLRGGLVRGRLALYAEQPYRFRLLWKRRPGTGSVPRVALPENIAWQGIRVDASDRAAKRRAVKAYRSQLPGLGLGNVRVGLMVAHEALRGGEAIAWVDAPHVPSNRR